ISGWIEKMSKQNQRGDKEFYLETWSGESSYTVDRVERGTTHVDPLCLSVLGGIQPAKLKKYLQTYEKYAGNDGFIERFQVTFMPEAKVEWTFIDREPNREAKTVFEESLHSLARLPSDSPQIYRFSPKAQVLADQWRCELEQENMAKGLHPILKGHFSKYRSLLPSLSLIIELLDDVRSSSVSDSSVSKAIGWCSTLKSHAKKFYAPLLEQSVSAAQILAERIKSGRLIDGMKLRDLSRKNWPLLQTSDQIV
ncbi:MAG: DUF3987 domain-containing protein, partial [Oligoflexales bacterium]|nr:DUF3987 domain-containing protein [Oligoflexales bacterium]